MKRVSILAMCCVLVFLTLGGIDVSDYDTTHVDYGSINVNTAKAENLHMIDGITDSIAQNIIEFRNANGPFDSLNELLKVKGMNRTRLNEIRRHLKIRGNTDFRFDEYMLDGYGI